MARAAATRTPRFLPDMSVPSTRQTEPSRQPFMSPPVVGPRVLLLLS